MAKRRKKSSPTRRAVRSYRKAGLHAASRAIRETLKKVAPKVDARHLIPAEEWAEMGVWVRTKSSWVSGIRFNKSKGTLHVEYRSGAVCVYDVDESVAKGMFNSSSMGKYVHAHLYSLPYRLARS